VGRGKHWQEFKSTGVEEVRRRVDRSVYDPEKQSEARKLLYRHDTNYQRAALIVAVVSFAALCVSAYGAFWKH
jgi:hypothetical protein